MLLTLVEELKCAVQCINIDIKPMANHLVEDITLCVLCWRVAEPYSVFTVVGLVIFCVEKAFPKHGSYLFSDNQIEIWESWRPRQDIELCHVPETNSSTIFCSVAGSIILLQDHHRHQGILLP